MRIRTANNGNGTTWSQHRSSCINGAMYDSSENSLVISFTSGTVYEYDDVPQHVFDQFDHPLASQGTLFQALFREQHPTTEIFHYSYFHVLRDVDQCSQMSRSNFLLKPHPP